MDLRKLAAYTLFVIFSGIAVTFVGYMVSGQLEHMKRMNEEDAKRQEFYRAQLSAK